jgi:hypothetical protein
MEYNPEVKEKNFKINGMEYHFKLIPTKSKDSDEKRPSLLTIVGMVLTGIYFISQTKGRIECKKIKEGEIITEKKAGTYKERWEESAEVSTQYLEMKLRKESPLKKIIINSSCYDDGTGFTESTLFQKKNFRTKKSLLEELK